MNLITKPLTFLCHTLLIIVVLFTLTANINTNSQTFPAGVAQTFKTTAERGLIMRNSNCKPIVTLAYGTLLNEAIGTFDDNGNYTPSTERLECTIGGKTYNMIKVSYVFGNIILSSDPQTSGEISGFVASNFIQPVLIDITPAFESGYDLYVSASLGLNLRDENCKRITAVPNSTKLMTSLYSPINEIFCSVRGITYAMTPVYTIQNGKTIGGYIATTYLEVMTSNHIALKKQTKCQEDQIYNIKANSCVIYSVPGM
jgi:hypothetical protein